MDNQYNSLKKVSAPSEEAKGVQEVVSKPVQTTQPSPVITKSVEMQSEIVASSQTSMQEETMSAQEAMQAVKACSIDNPDCESCSG